MGNDCGLGNWSDPLPEQPSREEIKARDEHYIDEYEDKRWHKIAHSLKQAQESMRRGQKKCV
jgi:hypothetical protein